MKLTNYILDLGRVVAYYPNLKKVTGSTTATILLCQLLYWSDKTGKNDEWIYKTSDEIEEETGLTYYEQKTAKESLFNLNLLEFEFKRLDHTSRYKINQEELNIKWEEIHGTKSESRTPARGSIEESFMKEVPVPEHRTSVEKKGDLVDLFVDAVNSPGLKKMNIKITIKEKMEKRFKIHADNKKWEEFIEFMYVRQEKFGEPVDRFITWALQEGFNPIYWTPEKMKTLYPQAFAETDSSLPLENFVEKLPERVEEVYAPMPEDLKKKKNLY